MWTTFWRRYKQTRYLDIAATVRKTLKMPKSRANHTLLSKLPSVDSILSLPEVDKLCSRYSRKMIVDVVREGLEEFKRRIISGEDERDIDRDEIIGEIARSVGEKTEEMLQTNLKRVINATGIILHTNLGRAPLSETAGQRLMEISQGYCNLEIDLESGERGHRTDHVEKLLRQLTNAEAAAVVNNNAAAVFLVLNTLSFGKETIVSRGELIEIGGSFRIPDVMDKSGAKMIEVGTTNRTHLKDYQSAICEKTGLILRVHQSNYKITGFTAQVGLDELIKLGTECGIPVVNDLGSGALIDLTRYGLPYEPVAKESIERGADVVTFSGDKVLGGPQAGLIIGKREFIDMIKQNPLMRTLRCDKLIYGALEGTLKLYLQEGELAKTHPVLRMMTEGLDTVKDRGRRLLGMLDDVKNNLDLKLEETEAQTGSGALPLEPIQSAAVSISPKEISASSDRTQSTGCTTSASKVSALLRANNPPIVGYVRNNRVFLDMRTVHDNEVELIAEAIKALHSKQ